MKGYSRREFCKLAATFPLAAEFPLPSFHPSLVGGLPFGVETFSFHDAPPAGDPQLIPTIIRNMKEAGLAECEIMSGHIEPWGNYATGWWVQTRKAPGFSKMREGRAPMAPVGFHGLLSQHPQAVRGRRSLHLLLQLELQRNVYRR